MPVTMKAWLASTAVMNRRSMNSEIVHRLEAAMRADQKADSPAAGEASRA